MKSLISRTPRSATALKILAVALMLLDHIHQMWAHAGAPAWLNMLGRPVFPIFLFIMAESWHYTRSKEKLLCRLLIASWLMAVINLVLAELLFPSDDITLTNNAFGTFFIATLYMMAYDMAKAALKEANIRKLVGAALIVLTPVLTILIPVTLATSTSEPPPAWLIRIILLIPSVFLAEGGPAFIALGLLFYVFRTRRPAQIITLAAISSGYYMLNPSSIQWMMIFAAIPIILYNGKKGAGLKNFFYAFYPAHIYILYIISMMLTH